MKFYMWSFGHILFILSPFIMAAVLYFLTKKASPKTNRLVGIILSVIAVLLLIARNLEIFVKSGYKIQPEIIPFQICHFANFILLFSFVLNNKTLSTVAFCFNLPFAMLSIIFADSLENYQTILTWRGMAYIFGHMLIVSITLWALLTDQIKITKKSFINSIIMIVCLFVFSVPINNLFNKLMPDFTSNYFYSLEPEGGTPLELYYNWGKEMVIFGLKVNLLYIFLSALLGVVILYVFRLIYNGYYNLKKDH